MNTHKITYMISMTASLLLLVGFAALPASAQITGTSTSTKAQINAAARLAKIITQSDTAINARIADLGKLSARIQAMTNVSSSEKTSISTEVQTNTTYLSALKAKIDADTVVATAQNDEKSIFGSYRIYALIIPRGYIAASADRVNTIVNMLTTIGVKLQTRITALQSKGKDVTALQTALTDLIVRIADAKIQAGIAHDRVISLSPDQGNKTILASNTAALKAARANIKTATQDLQAARQDAKTIIQGIKTLGAKTPTPSPASSTTSQ